MTTSDRRTWLRVAALSGAATLLSAAEEEKEQEVTATEDLMREHGVLRRTLLVYSEAAARLVHNEAGRIDPGALHTAAQLFRDFGEQYHEKQLEETYIFPEVRKGGGRAARDTDILVVQHNRGREITDYILRMTSGAKIGANAAEFAKVLESMFRMYANHTAREDTIVFPAWKKRFTEKQLDELADKFEDIEHKTFGKDGFDDAEKRISGVEQAFGLSDLAQFTAPPPPK